MKQYLTLSIILLFLNPSFGQKKMEIPENDVVHNFIKRLPAYLNKFSLKNLQTSTDSLNIRIWQTHEIFTLSYNDFVSSDYKFYTISDKPILSTSNFSEDVSQIILDSLLVAGIMELQDEKYRGIDGHFVFFEISTKNRYKIISFWSPNAERSADCRSAVQILNILNNTANVRGLRNDFLNSLDSGGYRWGMVSIRIDRFLSEDVIKTDFYSRTEERIKTELNITKKTNHWKYPSIIIDNKLSKIADLNQYSEKDVEKLEIIKPSNPIIFLYGTKGNYSIVKVQTR